MRWTYAPLPYQAGPITDSGNNTESAAVGVIAQLCEAIGVEDAAYHAGHADDQNHGGMKLEQPSQGRSAPITPTTFAGSPSPASLLPSHLLPCQRTAWSKIIVLCHPSDHDRARKMCEKDSVVKSSLDNGFVEIIALSTKELEQEGAERPCPLHEHSQTCAPPAARLPPCLTPHRCCNGGLRSLDASLNTWPHCLLSSKNDVDSSELEHGDSGGASESEHGPSSSSVQRSAQIRPVPLYVLPTSGSTGGKAKLVMGTRVGLRARTVWALENIVNVQKPMVDDDVECLSSPPHHVHSPPVFCVSSALTFIDSLSQSFLPFFVGRFSPCTLILLPEFVRQDAFELFHILRSYQITHLTLIPTILKQLIRIMQLVQNTTTLTASPSKVSLLPALRVLISSGEALSYQVSSRIQLLLPHARLWNLYGMSEACGDSTALDVSKWIMDQKGRSVEQQSDVTVASPSSSVPIGFPIADTQLFLMNPTLPQCQAPFIRCESCTAHPSAPSTTIQTHNVPSAPKPRNKRKRRMEEEEEEEKENERRIEVEHDNDCEYHQAPKPVTLPPTGNDSSVLWPLCCCPVGSVGELAIAGSGLAIGYLQPRRAATTASGLTLDRFQALPRLSCPHATTGESSAELLCTHLQQRSSTATIRVFRSGDMCRVLPGAERRLEWVSRLATDGWNETKIDGVRISLTAVEDAMMQCKQVSECAAIVVSTPVDRTAQRVVAVAVLDSSAVTSSELLESELREHVRSAHLSKHHQPALFLFRHSTADSDSGSMGSHAIVHSPSASTVAVALPHTLSGKLDRRRLKLQVEAELKRMEVHGNKKDVAAVSAGSDNSALNQLVAAICQLYWRVLHGNGAINASLAPSRSRAHVAGGVGSASIASPSVTFQALGGNSLQATWLARLLFDWLETYQTIHPPVAHSFSLPQQTELVCMILERNTPLALAHALYERIHDMQSSPLHLRTMRTQDQPQQSVSTSSSSQHQLTLPSPTRAVTKDAHDSDSDSHVGNGVAICRNRLQYVYQVGWNELLHRSNNRADGGNTVQPLDRSQRPPMPTREKLQDPSHSPATFTPFRVLSRSEDIGFDFDATLDWMADCEECVDAAPLLICRNDTPSDKALDHNERKASRDEEPRRIVIAASHSGAVFAFDADGPSLPPPQSSSSRSADGCRSSSPSASSLPSPHRRWRCQLPDRIECSGIVDPSGRVFLVGCYDRNLYAISVATGQVVARYEFDSKDAIIKSMPTIISPHQRVAVAAYDGKVCVLDYGEACAATRDSRGRSSFNPFHTTSSQFSAVTAPCMPLVANFDCGAPVYAALQTMRLVDHPDTQCGMIVADLKGYVRLLAVQQESTTGPPANSSCSLVESWRFRATSPVFSTPLLVPHTSGHGHHDTGEKPISMILIAAVDGEVTALNSSDGRVMWRCEVGGGKEIFASPAIMMDGLSVMVCGYDGSISLLHLFDGRLLQRLVLHELVAGEAFNAHEQEQLQRASNNTSHEPTICNSTEAHPIAATPAIHVHLSWPTHLQSQTVDMNKEGMSSVSEESNLVAVLNTRGRLALLRFVASSASTAHSSIPSQRLVPLLICQLPISCVGGFFSSPAFVSSHLYIAGRDNQLMQIRLTPSPTRSSGSNST